MINIHSHYEPLLATEEILNDVEVVILPDDQTQKKDNISPLNKLANPHKYQMYDLPRTQMDGGTKCTVTNNLHLLKDVKWYNRWFRLTVTMKGATSDNIIIPETQGYLQVLTITKGVIIEVLYYYSPEFISSLVSDNDVLLSNKNASDYVGQSMLKFFDQKELDKMERLPIPNLQRQVAKIHKQKLGDTTKCYTHNYGNCMLCCTHKNNSIVMFIFQVSFVLVCVILYL